MSEKSFAPDWLSAPGGTILDILEERGISTKELAKLLGYSIGKAERLLGSKDAITKDVAGTAFSSEFAMSFSTLNRT